MAAMDRREFVKRVGVGLAAGWAGARLSWPWPARAAGPELRLALLADAHLKDGDDRRPEARALARSVAEIRPSSPGRTWCSLPATWPTGAGPTPWIWAGKSWRISPCLTGRYGGKGIRYRGGIPPGAGAGGSPGSPGRFGGSTHRVRHRPRPRGRRAGLYDRGGPVPVAGPGAGAPVHGHAFNYLVPRSPGPALSPLAAVDRGRPGSGLRVGAILPGAVLHGHVHGAGVGGLGQGIAGKIPPISPLRKGGEGRGCLW